MAPLEFQAVVLAAGKGSRMTEITAGRPKCLLQVANMPIIWYPLRMLEKEGFQDAIVIVADTSKMEIQTALEKCGLSIKFELIALPPGKDDLGTADSLHFISEKIKADVVVVSCDFVTDAPLYPALELFRKNEAAVTMLFLNPSDTLQAEPLPTPGPKTKHKPERDLVGINADTSRLVLLASVSDFDETLPLSRGLLRKHPHLQLYSRLLDSHIYILRKWICKFIDQERSLSTLKGELLPYIVRKQSSKPSQVLDGDISTVEGSSKKDIYQFAQESTLVNKILPLSLSNDHWGDMKGTFQDDKIRCYAHIAPGHCFGMRVNTLQSYANINREILHKWEKVTGGMPLVHRHPKADVKSTQVDDATLVGESTQLSEKTSFRTSAIGANCSVFSRTRMANCIIMNNVKINEGCVLNNCILCDNVEIGANTELKDCLVGYRHSVGSGGKLSRAILIAFLLFFFRSSALPLPCPHCLSPLCSAVVGLKKGTEEPQSGRTNKRKAIRIALLQSLLKTLIVFCSLIYTILNCTWFLVNQLQKSTTKSSLPMKMCLWRFDLKMKRIEIWLCNQKVVLQFETKLFA